MRHVWAAVVMASLASTARAEPPRQANGVFVSRWRGLVVRGGRGLYTADAETEAVFTLVTYPSRLRTDLRTFQALTATVRPCSIPWQDAQGRTHIEGSGPRCPENGGFY